MRDGTPKLLKPEAIKRDIIIRFLVDKEVKAEEKVQE
jgi:hypothetical protein